MRVEVQLLGSFVQQPGAQTMTNYTKTTELPSNRPFVPRNLDHQTLREVHRLVWSKYTPVPVIQLRVNTSVASSPERYRKEARGRMRRPLQDAGRLQERPEMLLEALAKPSVQNAFLGPVSGPYPEGPTTKI